MNILSVLFFANIFNYFPNHTHRSKIPRLKDTQIPKIFCICLLTENVNGLSC